MGKKKWWDENKGMEVVTDEPASEEVVVSETEDKELEGIRKQEDFTKFG